MNRIVTARIDTPLGGMRAGVAPGGVCLLEFEDSGRIETQLRRLEQRLDGGSRAGESPLLEALQAQLDEYFSGQRRRFELPLLLAGTPFQCRAWAALQTIPYGETRSYREHAALLGNPAALRAVGKANGDNPIAILVPCHRLVGSDGSLTGYGGGLWRKEHLIELERSQRLALGV